MKQRMIVAVLGIPFLLVVILVLPPIATAILVALMCALGAYELLWRTGLVRMKRLVAYAMVMGFLTSIWSWLGTSQTAAFVGIFVFFAVLFCELLAGHTDLDFSAICLSLFAGLVFPFLLSALVRLRVMEDGKLYIITALILAFSADSGGYLIGCKYGKHRLAPVISPKKSVEGAIGGVVSSVVLMVLYALILQFALHREVSYLAAVVYGVLGALGSMLGDLGFSVIKRQTGIKDYGNLLPGHGGILDRFDSMTVVAPMTQVLVVLLPLIHT